MKVIKEMKGQKRKFFMFSKDDWNCVVKELIYLLHVVTS